MKRILMVGAAILISVSGVQAQSVTLSSAAAAPGLSTDVVSKYQAEIAAAIISRPFRFKQAKF